MAKRRRGKKKQAVAPKAPQAKPVAEAPKPAAETPKPEAAAPKSPAKPRAPKPVPAPEPTFWFGFEMSWAKLALGRVILFGLLAIDALVQIRHAPRYGASGFNVGQLGLDALGPTRTTYLVAELVNAYLFVLAASGIATRIAIPLATAIYAWLYFGSQLDSYQHHYLVALLLLLACFVPWQRPRDATPRTPVRTWAMRLVLIELGIMYLWAAISKMNTAWLDGHALALQIGGTLRHMIESTIGFKGIALVVLATELALAAMIWNPRTWRYAAPLGLLFHAGILLSTLEIGLFAWLMIGIYVFVVPDRIWIWLAERPFAPDLRKDFRAFVDNARWLVWLVAVGAGVALAVVSRFEYALVVGCVMLVVPLAAAVLYRDRRVATFAAAYLLALGTWTAVDRISDVASDYYLLWGGHVRRTGDRETAELLYRKAIAVDSNEATAHYQLGKLLIARGSDTEGLAELHVTQQLQPHAAGAFTAEARWLAAHDRKDDAVAKAKQATAADPGDKDARALLESLTGTH
jgi:hypothetical protein